MKTVTPYGLTLFPVGGLVLDYLYDKFLDPHVNNMIDDHVPEDYQDAVRNTKDAIDAIRACKKGQLVEALDFLKKKNGRKKAKEYGSYTNHHESGKKYHGQGDRESSQTSGKEKEDQYNDRHTATDWTPAPNRREAMKDQARRIENDGGIQNPNNYNQINSPGTILRPRL